MKKVFAILLSISLVLPCINGFTVLADEPVVTDTPNPMETIAPSDTPIPEETTAPTDTPIPTDTPEPEMYDLGDVDGSGIIEASDALSVLKYAAKISELDYSSSVAADVDKSGTIDAKDALYILQYAAKIRVRFVFDPVENREILKEYIINNANQETAIYMSSLIYYFNDGNDDDNIIESGLLSYLSTSDSFEFIYEVEIENELELYVRYKINGYDFDVEVKLYESFEKYYYDYKANSTFNINEFYNDEELTMESEKYKEKLPYYSSLAEKDYYNEVLDKVNAWIHLGIISLQDYLRQTVVMNFNDLGFKSYTYDDDYLYKLFYITNGIYHENNPDIENSIEEYKNFVIKNGIKDGSSYYMDFGWLTGGSNYGGGQEYNNYLVYDKEYDVLYFQKNVKYNDPDQYVIAIVQPFTNGTSYAYIEIYEYDSKGELEYINSLESYFKSRDVYWQAKFDLSYYDEPKKTVSNQDENLGNIIIVDLVRDMFYDLRNNYGKYISDIGYIDYTN